METFSTLLTLCMGNPPVTPDFPQKRSGNPELLCFVASLNYLWTIIWTTVKIRHINANADMTSLLCVLVKINDKQLKTQKYYSTCMAAMHTLTIEINDYQWLKPLLKRILSFLCLLPFGICQCRRHPDSKVHGDNMGPIWGWQDPGRPHVGHMNFAIWAGLRM